MNHAFGSSGEFTIGLEEELLLVDGETLRLDHAAGGLIERMELPFERGGHEAFLAEIEVRSHPSATAADAAAQIAEGRAAIRAAGGVPMAVATSSASRLFELKITRHRDWFARFRVVVNGDDPRIGHGKPAPDIYLLAARELGVGPEGCLAIEDAPAGVASARAAGARRTASPSSSG